MSCVAAESVPRQRAGGLLGGQERVPRDNGTEGVCRLESIQEKRLV